jgi:hypothetical protein
LLAEAALEQAVKLPVIPKALIPIIRESYAAQWATGALGKNTSPFTIRRLKHLDATCNLARSYRLFRACRVIDWIFLGVLTALHLTIAILMVLYSQAPWSTLDRYGYFSQDLLFVGGAMLFIMYGFEGGNSATFACARQRARNCVWSARLLPSLWWRSLLAFILVYFAARVVGITELGAEYFDSNIAPSSGLFVVGASVIVLGWACWGHSAPFAALTGHFVRRWQWPLVFVAPLAAMPKWLGGIVTTITSGALHSRTLALTIISSPVVVGIPMIRKELHHLFPGIFRDLDHPYGPTNWGLVIVTAAIVTIALRVGLNGLRLSIYEVSMRLFPRTPIDLQKLLSLSLLNPLFFGSFDRHRLLHWVRLNGNIVPNEANLRMVRDLSSAISRDLEKHDRLSFKMTPPDPSWDDSVKRLYRGRRQRGTGLAFLGGSVLDEIVALQAQLENARELSDETQTSRNRSYNVRQPIKRVARSTDAYGLEAPAGKSSPRDARKLRSALTWLIEITLIERFSDPRALLSNAFFRRDCDPRRSLMQGGVPAEIAQQWVDTLLHFKCSPSSDHPLATLLETAYQDQREPQVDFEGGWQGLLARLRELNPAGAG